jgi:predicted nucleic acid-binding protein
VKFWDASAIIPLLVEETITPAVLELYRADPLMIAWWGSEVECASAIARLERDGALSLQATSAALTRLDALSASWQEVLPVEPVKDAARRLLRIHDLRTADALQLAAALAAGEQHPGSLEIVCLDHRLAAAAQREGLRVARVG